MKFKKLVGIKDAERLGSAFPRGAWERAKVVPAFYNGACCITGMTLLEPGKRDVLYSEYMRKLLTGENAKGTRQIMLARNIMEVASRHNLRY